MIGWLRSYLTGDEPKTVPPQPPAEPDWSPGDIAKCLTGQGDWLCAFTGAPMRGPPFGGQILRVSAVWIGLDTVWLEFRGVHGSFPAGHFRKLRPSASDFAHHLRCATRVPDFVQ